MERIVLAYSGGLDTSVAIPWLAEKYNAEIVAVTMDLGQGKELDDVRERALAIGAVRAHVIDLREEFARGAHFGCQAVDQRRPLFAWQDVPRVGFDFEVRGVVQQEDFPQGALEVAPCCLQRADRFGVDRHVEVDPPLVGAQVFGRRFVAQAPV